MLYPELFASLEAVRWSLTKDIPWDQYDPARLSDEQAPAVFRGGRRPGGGRRGARSLRHLHEL